MSLAHLSTLDPARLQRLLEARPDLLAATTLEDLARLAASGVSVREAFAALPAPARQVAEALSLFPGWSFSQLAGLDPDVDVVALREVVDGLRDRLLLGAGEELHLVASATHHLPTPLGLGRPVARCHEQTSHYELCAILQCYGEPRPRSGDAARDALRRVFETAGFGAALLGLSEELVALLRRVDEQGPVLRIAGVDPVMGVLPAVPGLAEAVALGMLAVIGPGRVEIPREIALALRWPVLTRFRLTAPDLAGVVGQGVEAACGAQVHELLDDIERLGTAIQTRPLPLLGSGGVGLKELRALGAEPARTSLLLRLLEGLGLVAATRKELRITKAWTAWVAQEEADRWSELAGTWLSGHHPPAAAPGTERKAKAALSWDYDLRLPGARLELVRLLGSADDRAHDGAGWLALWHHRRPETRLTAHDGRGYLVDRDLRIDVLYEAEVLGVLSAGVASPLARAVFRGDAIGPVLSGLSDAGEQRVRAQADMTLICTGRPSRGMRQALDRIATVEQSGAATVWRISEQSLSRAYDEGDTPDTVQEVLEGFAGDVPQSMAYLVKDAHRRHGQVRVGTATSYVVVDDDARLQDALAGRGKAAKALGIRRIAPGVAVSKGSVAQTVAALRELGLSAVAETSAAGRPTVRTATASTRGVVPVLPVLDVAPAARELAERLAR